MRLFIAIVLNDEVKSEIEKTQNKLREFAFRGNFTAYENLHLTLVFIGETAGSQVPVIQSAMDEVMSEPFEIGIQGVGSFKRNSGDIWWLGVNEGEVKPLTQIYNQLYENLTSEGFKLDTRRYKPHLTIAREVIISNSYHNISFSEPEKRITAGISKISLMKSEYINRVLTYTEIYEKYL